MSARGSSRGSSSARVSQTLVVGGTVPLCSVFLDFLFLLSFLSFFLRFFPWCGSSCSALTSRGGGKRAGRGSRSRCRALSCFCSGGAFHVEDPPGNYPGTTSGPRVSVHSCASSSSVLHGEEGDEREVTLCVQLSFSRIVASRNEGTVLVQAGPRGEDV